MNRAPDIAVSKHRIALPAPGREVVLRFGGDAESAAVPAVVRSVKRRFILVELPTNSSADRPHIAGELVHASYFRDNGLYCFETRIARVRSGPTRSISLTVPNAAHRIQRRREFRLPMHRAARMTISPSNGRPTAYPVQLLDLSAVGAFVHSPTEAREGILVVLDVPIGDGVVEPVTAQVLECRSRSDGDDGFAVRLQFDDGDRLVMPQSLRDEIARFIFEEQRALLKLRRLLNAGPANPTKQKKTRILTSVLAWMRAPSQGWKL